MPEPVMVTIADLAEQMHMKTDTLYELARRDDDPLPLRTMNGFKRSSSVVVSEWIAWFERNSSLFKETRHK